MKKQLLKKLYAFIVTSMMFSASANAQIIYTDIVPDSTYTINFWGIQTYNLDLNGDGTTDFLIQAARPHPVHMEDPAYKYVSITPQGSNAFITTTFSTVKKLILGDTISSSQAWNDTTYQFLKWYKSEWINFQTIVTDTGEWDTVVDGYIGLQLIHAGQTYYGWVRMDVDLSLAPVSMTIKDYAYNSIPNQPILAGETTTTGIIENSFASSINLYPNPATNHVTIAFGSNNKKVEVTITDITGKIIYTTIATDTQKAEVNTQDFKAGIYVVRIQTAENLQTEKLIVTK